MQYHRVADLLVEWASLAARQAEITAELAVSLRAGPPQLAPAALPEYLKTREAAAFLGVSERTLEALRAEGRGPRFVRVGRAVRYPRDWLIRGDAGTNGGAPTPRAVAKVDS